MTRPDPEMVAKVAKAFFDECRILEQEEHGGDIGSPWTTLDEKQQDQMRRVASAAIEASGLLSLQRERDELMALIRECRLADARWDRAFRALCEAEHAALAHVENEESAPVDYCGIVVVPEE